MDDWRKKLAGHLGSHSIAAIALKELEQFNRLDHFATDSQLNASVAAEYQRTTLLSAMQEQVAVKYAEANYWKEASQFHLAISSSAMIDEAKRIAELAQTYTLPSLLDQFRTPTEPFANRLLHLQTLDMVNSPAYLGAFIQTSAISDLFVESIRVDRTLQEATRQFALEAVPSFDSLNDYRQFLDAAGLGLSRWPNVRLLTIKDKRRHFRNRLSNNAEPFHVKKAKSLAQRYELTLRDILDEVMASEYGEDWAEERLPLCDCKDLLGKWQKRGGEVLSHADFAHYKKIMSYPEHFEAVFAAGFDDPMDLAVLIEKAGKLRAALLHYHPFAPEDLRDMRLIWRTIETGLLALIVDYEFDC